MQCTTDKQGKPPYRTLPPAPGLAARHYTFQWARVVPAINLASGTEFGKAGIKLDEVVNNKLSFDGPKRGQLADNGRHFPNYRGTRTRARPTQDLGGAGNSRIASMRMFRSLREARASTSRHFRAIPPMCERRKDMAAARVHSLYDQGDHCDLVRAYKLIASRKELSIRETCLS